MILRTAILAVLLVVALVSPVSAQMVSKSRKPILIDDFESGTLAAWTVSSSGAGD